MLKFLPLGIFLLLAVLLALPLLQGKDPSFIASPMIGRQAPASPKIPRGQPALVNVFASWCVSCREEQAILKDIAKEESIAVYGLDYKDTPPALKKFLSATGNPFRDVTPDEDGRMGIDWGITGVPETFVVDKDGVIRYKYAGPITQDVADTILHPMLAELKQ